MPAEAPQHFLKPIPDLDWAVSQAVPERETRPREDGDPDARMVPAEPVADVSGDAAELTEAVQEAVGVPSYDVVGADDLGRVPEAAADEIEASLAAEDEAAQTAAVGDGDPAGAGDGPEPGLQPIAADVDRRAWPVAQGEPLSPDQAASEVPPENGSAPDPETEAPAGQMAAAVATGMGTTKPDLPAAEPPSAHSAVAVERLGGAAVEAHRVETDELSADGSMPASDWPGAAAALDPGAAPLIEEVVGGADGALAEDPGEPDDYRACDGSPFGELRPDSPGGLDDPGERQGPAPGPSAEDRSSEDTFIEPRMVADVVAEASPPGGEVVAEEENEAALQPEKETKTGNASASASGMPALSSGGGEAAAAADTDADFAAAIGSGRDAGSDTSALPEAIHAAVMRRPGEYRPRLKRARTRRAQSAGPTGVRDVQSLNADLLLLIGAADWGVQLSALLRIPEGAEEEIAVDQGGVETWLGHLDDQLLEPLALSDASAAFREPLLVTAVGLPVRWSRTSRDLHVLGPHPRVAGFASQARVVIGQECVVICREGLADAARAQIRATGSAEPVPIEGPNVPAGWVCWRGVRPVRPSLPAGGESILDALDPLPAVSIEFSGGIQLSRAAWLEGRPPSIRLLGLMSEGDPVLIDGAPASRDGAGDWTAPGWDRPGAHSVDHGGKSASYAIERGADGWEWWPAWEGPTRLAGALSEAGGGELFHHSGPAALLGARPGQICGFAPSTSGVGVARPDFEPVWLVTAPGTRRAGVSLIGQASPPGMPVGPNAALERWVRTVCSCGRTGAVPSGTREAWSRYVAVARSHRRRRR